MFSEYVNEDDAIKKHFPQGLTEKMEIDKSKITKEYRDGTIYIQDEAEDGRKAAFGRMAFMDGAVYNGEFSDGLPHGYGVKFWDSGVRY